VAAWKNSHTQTSIWGPHTGRGEAEDVVVVVAGPEPGGKSAGQRYREGAGRWMVWDRRMIRKLGSDVVEREHQTAPNLLTEYPILPVFLYFSRLTVNL